MRHKPSTCTNGKWNVSATMGDGISGAILSVFVVVNHNPFTMRRGDHDGREFRDSDEAFAFALERGYLQHYRRRTRRLHQCDVRYCTREKVAEERVCDHHRIDRREVAEALARLRESMPNR